MSLHHQQFDREFFDTHETEILSIYRSFIDSKRKVFTYHCQNRADELRNSRAYHFVPLDPEESLLEYKNQYVKMHPEDLTKLRDCDFSFLPSDICVENIFEVECFEGQAFKIVFRIPLPNTPDTHISCVVTGRTMKTFWLNESTDNHITLQKNKYE